MSSGSELIANERRRQIEAEGWTPEHDADHSEGELALAATCYAAHVALHVHGAKGEPPPGWPWDASWWKPSPDPIRNLVKAGALIAAEIDRLSSPTPNEKP